MVWRGSRVKIPVPGSPPMQGRITARRCRGPGIPFKFTEEAPGLMQVCLWRDAARGYEHTRPAASPGVQAGVPGCGQAHRSATG